MYSYYYNNIKLLKIQVLIIVFARFSHIHKTTPPFLYTLHIKIYLIKNISRFQTGDIENISKTLFFTYNSEKNLPDPLCGFDIKMLVGRVNIVHIRAYGDNVHSGHFGRKYTAFKSCMDNSYRGGLTEKKFILFNILLAQKRCGFIFPTGIARVVVAACTHDSRKRVKFTNREVELSLKR